MTKRRKLVKNVKPVVKKIALPKVGVVRVVVPPGVLPVVAVDPDRKIVEIVPVQIKPTPKKKESWWSTFFGPG